MINDRAADGKGEKTMTLADWKEREKEQRRNDILDAAMKLFYAKGYDEVSMSDIAAKVGIKKPTLYLYFKNKESLFFAIVARAARVRNPLVRAEISKCKTGDEKLKAAARVSTEIYVKHPEYSWADYFFRSGRFDLENTENEDIKAILDLQWEMFEILRDIVRFGMEDGTYVPGADPLSMALWMNMVAENTYNLRPDYKYMLERGGVRMDEFAADVDYLTRRAVMTGDRFAALDHPGRRAVIAKDYVPGHKSGK
jgi:Transcriptional regulator